MHAADMTLSFFFFLHFILNRICQVAFNDYFKCLYGCSDYKFVAMVSHICVSSLGGPSILPDCTYLHDLGL